ncbi:hypothetical protein HMPREF3202_00476 [Prevotella bivia]|uniref:Uncharacterized protein n=1 Tax=Prevotella bivia TaxID=28125 RepID=A0A137T009_9BACT|nr:hypothetical protein HMPREF3202_00476 [Prevotella bivia]
MHKIGCIQQYSNKFVLHSFALSLHKIGNLHTLFLKSQLL